MFVLWKNSCLSLHSPYSLNHRPSLSCIFGRSPSMEAHRLSDDLMSSCPPGEASVSFPGGNTPPALQPVSLTSGTDWTSSFLEDEGDGGSFSNSSSSSPNPAYQGQEWLLIKQACLYCPFLSHPRTLGVCWPRVCVTTNSFFFIAEWRHPLQGELLDLPIQTGNTLEEMGAHPWLTQHPSCLNICISKACKFLFIYLLVDNA